MSRRLHLRVEKRELILRTARSDQGCEPTTLAAFGPFSLATATASCSILPMSSAGAT